MTDEPRKVDEPRQVDGPRRVDGEYIIPPSAIYAAIDRAAHHHAELVDQQFLVLDQKIEVVKQRISDMDEADALLRETVNRVPTELQREIAHVRERMALVIAEVEAKINAHAILDIKSFETIELRFQERDKRFELSAIENQKAIDKAERSTSETINKNADLANKSLDAVREALNDLKDRVVILESIKRGETEERTERRAGNSTIYGAIAAVGATISILIIVVGFIIDSRLGP